MDSQGWIKIHRKILSWEWFKDDHTFKIFIYLLLSANHEDKKWKGINIKRGQIIAGRNSISANTGISVRSVRTSLNHLKSTSEITIKTTNRYSIITINKYDDYQTKDILSDQQTDQQTVTQPTSNRPATDHKQEYKNNKNVKNIPKEEIFKEEKPQVEEEEKPEEEYSCSVYNEMAWLNKKREPIDEKTRKWLGLTEDEAK